MVPLFSIRIFFVAFVTRILALCDQLEVRLKDWAERGMGGRGISGLPGAKRNLALARFW
jgi:hypothetical protein